MDCKKFHYWLNNRDIHDTVLPKWAGRHINACCDCKELFQKDNELELGIARALALEPLPRGMAERINLSLDHGTGSSPRNLKKNRVFSMAAVAGLITLAFLWIYAIPTTSPVFTTLDQISLQAVTDHLKGNRQMDFTAKEMDTTLARLTRELGFKVLLPDLEDLGATLMGGRICTLGDCRAAYFVVRQKEKTGSLFIMSNDYLGFPMADGTRFDTRIKGCETCVWKNHDQIYAMVF